MFKSQLTSHSLFRSELTFEKTTTTFPKTTTTFPQTTTTFPKKNHNYSRLPDDDDEASEGTEKKGMFKKNRKGQVDVFKSQLHSDFM